MITNHDCAVILDFGAVNAQITAKAVRRLNIYCEVLPYSADIERVKALKPKALIYQRGEEFGEHTLKKEIPRDTVNLGLPVLDLSISPVCGSTLEDFLVKQCGLRQNWTAEAFIHETVEELRGTIQNSKVLLTLSGGVDSSVCAALLHRAAGSQLTCVFVDHGFMRKDEPQQIREVFKDRFGINLVSVDAQERFLNKLKDVTNPEEKRKQSGL